MNPRSVCASRNYSQDYVTKALEEIKLGSSLRKTAIKLNIPCLTLSNRNRKNGFERILQQ